MNPKETRYWQSVHATNTDYDCDPGGRLLYFDYTQRQLQLLEPAQIITDLNIAVGKIGQQNLLPAHLALKRKDLEPTEITGEEGIPIGEPIPPGVSAFLFFGSPSARQHELSAISQSHLGREVHWKNKLYVTQLGDVVRAGWTAFYAPLIDSRYEIYNPLHILIAPNSIIETGILMDATQEEKTALANAFVRWSFTSNQ